MREIRVRFQPGVKTYPVETVACAVSYAMCTGSPFDGGKAAGGVKLKTQFNMVPRLGIVKLYVRSITRFHDTVLT
jgi:hypothetical protein